MSTFPQKHIDIVGIGASTLDRFYRRRSLSYRP